MNFDDALKTYSLSMQTQKNSGISSRVDRYLESLRVLKQTLELSADARRRVDCQERLLKLVKKHAKDHKLTSKEIDGLYGSCFESVKSLIAEAENMYKQNRSDFEAVMLKRKHHGCVELKGLSIPMPVCSENTLSEEEISQKCVAQVNFEIQSLSISKLCGAIADRLHKLLKAVLGERCCEKKTARNFVEALSRCYNVVPYHNFTHATGVFFMFCHCYSQKQAADMIDPIEMLFGGLACLGHDIRHEGINNLYHAKSRSQLAIDFSYAGALERMHLWKMNRFLESEGKSLLDGLSKEDITRGRRVLTRAILSTDMTRHYDYVDNVKLRNTRSTISKEAFSSTLAQDREYFVEVITHGCDIGNPCLSYPNYIHWANLVCLEFNDQTIKEQTVGLEPTSFLKFTTLNNFYRNQSSFTSTVVLPLWTEIAVFLPDLRPLREQIVVNVKKLDQTQKEEVKKR